MRSKTDQTGHRRTVHLHRRPDSLCPVRAIEDWLSVSGIRDEALFHPAEARSPSRRLSGRVIAGIAKKRVASTGLRADRFSWHSLRAGFATSDAMAGFDATLIARQTGHHAQQMVAAYVRVASVPQMACLGLKMGD